MRLNFVLFALGAWLLQRQAELPPLAAVWMATAVLGLTAAACVAAPSRWRYAARLLSAMAWLAAGFAWAATLADIRLADRLPQVWEGRDVRVIGVIATLPQMLEHGMRFALDVEEVVTPGAQVPAHIGLSWWGAARERPQIRAGERWAFTVRLKRPHGRTPAVPTSCRACRSSTGLAFASLFMRRPPHHPCRYAGRRVRRSSGIRAPALRKDLIVVPESNTCIPSSVTGKASSERSVGEVKGGYKADVQSKWS